MELVSYSLQAGEFIHYSD